MPKPSPLEDSAVAPRAQDGTPRVRDTVSSFVRRTRWLQRETAAALADLSTRRAEGVAAPQGASSATHVRPSATSHVDDAERDCAEDPLRAPLGTDLLGYDAELGAVIEELRQQNVALAEACALLERERAKYVDLFVQAPDAYVVTDLAGRVQDVNALAGVLLSIDGSSFHGRPLIGLVARQDTRLFRSFLRSAATDSPLEPIPLQLRMRPRGQAVVAMDARISVVRNAESAPVALRWLLRPAQGDGAPSSGRADREATEELIDELREPLGWVARWALLLRSGQLDPDEEKRAFTWVEKWATTQHATLTELAELGDAAMFQRDREELVDLCALAREVVAAVAAEGSSRLEMTGNVAAVAVRGSAAHVRRLVEILLARALAGTPEGLTVHLRVHGDGARARISVETPDGAAAPAGWAVRLTIAARVARMCRAQLSLERTTPAAHLTFPLSVKE